jgi:hypothetical protein
VQALESIMDLFMHRDFLGLHFGHKWFMYFGCASGFSRLVTQFLVEALSQTWHISMIFLSWETHRVMGVYSKPLNEALGSTIDLLWWYKPFIYGRLCPIWFWRSWVLVALYLCSKFHIFDRPVLEEYVSQVEGGHTSFGHAFLQFGITFFL